MPPKKPPPKPKNGEVGPDRSVFWFMMLNRAFNSLDKAIPWLGAIGIAYFAIYQPVLASKGVATTISYAVSLVTDLKGDQWIAYIVGGGGVAYGLAERRFRKKTVQQLSARVKSKEEALDPDRSSSSLTPQGESPEETPGGS